MLRKSQEVIARNLNKMVIRRRKNRKRRKRRKRRLLQFRANALQLSLRKRQRKSSPRGEK